MKLKFAVLTTVVVAVATMIVWLAHAPQLETLISPSVALTPQWQEVRPARGMQTSAAWSELLLEVPSQQFRQRDGELVLEDGSPFRIEAYLTTDKGEQVTLDRVSPVSYNGRSFVRLSAARLEGRQQDYLFSMLALRSNVALRTGKVIWMSYDPRDTKDGVAFPKR